MEFFDIGNIAFTILSYPVSYLELAGTAAGIACVFLTAREKVLCWPVGIVNILLFFIMFYQVQLYSDMLLQIYFLIMSFYGWWKWTHPKDAAEANKQEELKISNLTPRWLTVIVGGSLLLVIIAGTGMKDIHQVFPQLFPKPAAFPYGDAFTTVLSITATILMALKKRECWIFWVTVDTVAVLIYFIKGINLVAMEYIIFGLIALSGYINWSREQRGSRDGKAEWEPAS
jgi:nicotinamide mononucleotide transporter